MLPDFNETRDTLIFNGIAFHKKIWAIGSCQEHKKSNLFEVCTIIELGEHNQILCMI